MTEGGNDDDDDGETSVIRKRLEEPNLFQKHFACIWYLDLTRNYRLTDLQRGIGGAIGHCKSYMDSFDSQEEGICVCVVFDKKLLLYQDKLTFCEYDCEPELSPFSPCCWLYVAVN